MWARAILIGLLIGILFIAVSIKAQSTGGDQSQVLSKLDQILENQDQMFKTLHFIKNKV